MLFVGSSLMAIAQPKLEDKNVFEFFPYKGLVICTIPWRNGSASDSRSEGCVFESRRGHIQIMDECSISTIVRIVVLNC